MYLCYRTQHLPVMKKTLFFIFLLALTACNTLSTEEKIDNLNGYWGISEVKTADGEVRQYTINAWVDYIEINATNKGFRKKVKPKFDGSYIIAGNDAEKITVKVENDSINLYYNTGMANWKETLIYSSEDKITFKNKYGNTYTYTRFTGYLEKPKDE